MIGRMLLIGLTAVLVAGCSATSGLDAAQIASVSDEQVCDPLASGYVVKRERELRGLGDCGPGAVQCKSMGYNPGSNDYLNCRQMFMQQAMAGEANRQQLLKNFQSDWQKAYAPRPSTTSYTTCGQGNTNETVDCRTTTR